MPITGVSTLEVDEWRRRLNDRRLHRVRNSSSSRATYQRRRRPGPPVPGRSARRRIPPSVRGMLSASAIQHDPRLEVAARLLLRSEDASSRIEAINPPADIVAIADVDPSVGGPAAWVAASLHAVDAALTHRGRLTFEALWDWHRILMASADLDDQYTGAWRDRLGWVSGPTPQQAVYVATTADRTEVLMGGPAAVWLTLLSARRCPRRRRSRPSSSWSPSDRVVWRESDPMRQRTHWSITTLRIPAWIWRPPAAYSMSAGPATRTALEAPPPGRHLAGRRHRAQRAERE